MPDTVRATRPSTAIPLRDPDPLSIGMFLGRSLFPIAAVVLITGTLWWGPWVTLALTFVWWRVVTWNG